MLEKWLHLVAAAFLVLGGLVWGVLGLTKSNIVEYLLGRRLAPAIYLLVGLAALYLGLRVATYLPFLGETIVPCSILKDQEPDHADTVVYLHGLLPGAKILFWAAEPATVGLATIQTWQQAYLDYANAGVTTVDEAGHAALRIRRPQPYIAPIMGALTAHVHWRVCDPSGKNGSMLGPVQITPISG
jgi:uncharacterized membrane protein YuzA (DUF378 family)